METDVGAAPDPALETTSQPYPTTVDGSVWKKGKAGIPIDLDINYGIIACGVIKWTSHDHRMAIIVAHLPLPGANLISTPRRVACQFQAQY